MVEAGSAVGNYQVLQRIGQGAMGAVYLAVHGVLGKRVALKVIHPELATNDDIVHRFFNEARAATQIGHANIVDVQDFGQTPDGDNFIVMELLEGIGLGELIKREGQLPIERAIRIAIQLTDGLRAAHTRGIIHRDLKPDNIFLVPRAGDPDFVKILDFGLAKLTGPGVTAHRTRAGAVLGTAHYMAPEAAEDSRSVDHRCDVYALGCIIFQMVIGRVPFPGEGFAEVLVRQLREPPPLATRLRPDVPKWLEQVILHALAKKQEFRFPSMEEFGRALRDPAGWERAFNDRDVTEDKFPSQPPRHATPGGMEAARSPTSRSGQMRPTQLPADARTISSEIPGSMPSPRHTEYVPGPASANAWRGQQAPARDGTAELRNPFDLATELAPGAEASALASMARRKTASALGVAAAVIGIIAVLGAGAGLVHHLFFSQVTVSITTEPSGVDIILGAQVVGTTPAQVKLASGKEAVQVRLQKVGYVSVRRSIEPTRDLALDVTLLPEPRPAPPEPERTVATAPPEPEEQGGLEPLAPAFDPKGTETKGKTRPASMKGSRPKPQGGKKRDSEQTYKSEGLLLAPTF